MNKNGILLVLGYLFMSCIHQKSGYTDLDLQVSPILGKYDTLAIPNGAVSSDFGSYSIQDKDSNAISTFRTAERNFYQDQTLKNSTYYRYIQVADWVKANFIYDTARGLYFSDMNKIEEYVLKYSLFFNNRNIEILSKTFGLNQNINSTEDFQSVNGKKLGSIRHKIFLTSSQKVVYLNFFYDQDNKIIVQKLRKVTKP